MENPDFIIKDGKHDGTVFMVKKLQETNLNVVVRVVLETDKRGVEEFCNDFLSNQRTEFEKID